MRVLSAVFTLVATTAWAQAPRVAVDIAPVHGLVSSVMAGVGAADLIIPPGASPHGYAMRPSEARNLAAADLVIWVGPALTPWLAEPIATLAPNAQVHALLDVAGATALPIREGVGFAPHTHGDHAADAEHGSHENHAEHEGHENHENRTKHDAQDADRGHDHDGHDGHEGHDDHAAHSDHGAYDPHQGHDADLREGGIDPHGWLDPLNGALWAADIAEQLARIDPENAAQYRSNAVALAQELRQFTTDQQAAFAPLRDRPFVVLHDAFQYVEMRFGLRAVASVHDGEAASPGAARVSELRHHLQEIGVVCGFAEPQLNQALLATVTEGLPVKTGVLDPLGGDVPLGAGHYLATLKHLVQDMQACLTPAG